MPKNVTLIFLSDISPVIHNRRKMKIFSFDEYDKSISLFIQNTGKYRTYIRRSIYFLCPVDEPLLLGIFIKLMSEVCHIFTLLSLEWLILSDFPIFRRSLDKSIDCWIYILRLLVDAMHFYFCSIRVFFYRHWRLTEQQTKVGNHLHSSLRFPPAHEQSNIYFQLCMWDDYHVFLIVSLM